jgi:pimeloyl-ACP methyl ester carboxylesterase
VRAEELDLARTGSGPLVLFVHGSVVGAKRTWRRQHALASEWSLAFVNRPGFGASPPLPRGDFEIEAPLIADLCEQLDPGGVHLVGHSYGAVIALHAAALAPHAIRSLAISEPGCMRVAAHDPAVAAQIASGELLYEHAAELEPLDFLRAFRGGVGSTNETPEQLQGELLAGAELLMRERPPWEADPPLQELREASFPKLAISGGHSPVFEAICDVVAERIGARRERIVGRGHTIPSAGEPYNELLAEFMRGD